MSWKLGGKSRVVRKEVGGGRDDREQGKISDKVTFMGYMNMKPIFSFDSKLMKVTRATWTREKRIMKRCKDNNNRYVIY